MGSPLPDAMKPEMPAEQVTMTYHDGTSRTVYDTGIERPYPDGKLIVSRTDLDGILTHVNDAFVENLCKDGSHYWVYATVVPNVRRGETVGYTSVRRKPSRSKIDAAIAQYAQMKQDEEA